MDLALRPSLALALAAALTWPIAGSAQPAKGSPEHIKAAVAKVDGRFIRANAATGRDWPSYGLDYAETRHSRLAKITTDNVKDLGLVWSYDLESTRGVEATPVVVDGVMYVTASWSIVHAIDVRTGKRLWVFDPQVDRSKGYRGCCDVANRGVAVWQGKVFVAAYDGRLFGLDAATGTKVWEQDTIVDRKMSYTITGAPRVFKGKVIIGNGGAEYGVRGYLTAYDAATGKQAWRWFSVPGDPAKGFEDAVDGQGREDLGPGRQVVGGRRRRHDVGHHGLRPRPEPDVRRHRQRQPLGAQQAQPDRRRQPVPVVASSR